MIDLKTFNLDPINETNVVAAKNLTGKLQFVKSIGSHRLRFKCGECHVYVFIQEEYEHCNTQWLVRIEHRVTTTGGYISYCAHIKGETIEEIEPEIVNLCDELEHKALRKDIVNTTEKLMNLLEQEGADEFTSKLRSYIYRLYEDGSLRFPSSKSDFFRQIKKHVAHWLREQEQTP